MSTLSRKVTTSTRMIFHDLRNLHLEVDDLIGCPVRPVLLVEDVVARSERPEGGCKLVPGIHQKHGPVESMGAPGHLAAHRVGICTLVVWRWGLECPEGERTDDRVADHNESDPDVTEHEEDECLATGPGLGFWGARRGF